MELFIVTPPNANPIQQLKNAIPKRKVYKVSNGHKSSHLGSIEWLNHHLNNSLLVSPYVTANNHKSTTSKLDLIELSKDKYKNSQETEISPKNLLYRLAKKDTLVINKLQYFDSEAKEISTLYTESFIAKVNINLYYSYINVIGINLHFDYLDTLIIQTHGTKHWKIHKSCKGMTSKPIGGNQKPSDDDNDYLDFTTKKGDILFIPKGIWHYAYTTEDSSIHLSLSLSGLTTSQIFNYLLNEKLNNSGEEDIYNFDINTVADKIQEIIKMINENPITKSDINSMENTLIPEIVQVRLE